MSVGRTEAHPEVRQRRGYGRTVSDLGHIAAVLLVAAATISAAVAAAVLFAVLGPAGLIVGSCLVAVAPGLAVMAANRFPLGGPLSGTVIVSCVWTALVVALGGLPLLGFPLTIGD